MYLYVSHLRHLSTCMLVAGYKVRSLSVIRVDLWETDPNQSCVGQDFDARARLSSMASLLRTYKFVLPAHHLMTIS